MSSKTQESVQSPLEAILPFITGQWLARSLYVVAKLGVADLLADGQRSVDQLAETTRMHSNSLYRVIRALASVGFFTEIKPRHFELTPLGEALKTDAPGALRSTVLTLTGQWQWKSWGEILYCVQTGQTGTEKVFGKNVFDYLSENPEEAGWFNDAMEGFHGPEAPAVAKAYDFSGAGTIVDVGGGSGTLLTTILQAYPQTKGLLFDLPHAAEQSNERFNRLGLSDRCKFVEGTFFESIPEGDVYTLSHIIHDWNEDQCVTILANCKQANPAAKVLIVEMVLPPGDAFHPGKLLDLQMLALPGGQERTEEEYAALFGKAGYKLARVVPTESPVSVVEGIPL